MYRPRRCSRREIGAICCHGREWSPEVPHSGESRDGSSVPVRTLMLISTFVPSPWYFDVMLMIDNANLLRGGFLTSRGVCISCSPGCSIPLSIHPIVWPHVRMNRNLLGRETCSSKEAACGEYLPGSERRRHVLSQLGRRNPHCHAHCTSSSEINVNFWWSLSAKSIFVCYRSCGFGNAAKFCTLLPHESFVVPTNSFTKSLFANFVFCCRLLLAGKGKRSVEYCTLVITAINLVTHGILVVVFSYNNLPLLSMHPLRYASQLSMHFMRDQHF